MFNYLNKEGKDCQNIDKVQPIQEKQLEEYFAQWFKVVVMMLMKIDEEQKQLKNKSKWKGETSL